MSAAFTHSRNSLPRLRRVRRAPHRPLCVCAVPWQPKRAGVRVERHALAYCLLAASDGSCRYPGELDACVRLLPTLLSTRPELRARPPPPPMTTPTPTPSASSLPEHALMLTAPRSQQSTTYETVTTSPHSPTSPPRPALLLLGDSRDRAVYFSSVRATCSDELTNLNWTAPAPANPFVSAGASCRPVAELSAFGYLLHYGVSPDGIYHELEQGWKDLTHRGWQGPGWVDGDGGSRFNSPELVLEALRRWKRSTPDAQPRLVVLGSQAWDLSRYLEHFSSTLSPAAWADEYSANLTALAEQLLVELRPTDRLVLETSLHAVAGRIPPFLSALASERMRAVAKALARRGKPVLLLDLARDQATVEEAANGTSLLSADGLHATTYGERRAWRLLRALLQSSGDLPPDAGPTCLISAAVADEAPAPPGGGSSESVADSSAVQFEGQVLEMSRRCEWADAKAGSMHISGLTRRSYGGSPSTGLDVATGECAAAPLIAAVRHGEVNKRQLELVVLQHAEDIGWTDVVDPIRTVYVKKEAPGALTLPSTAIHLLNVGREQGSMLWHVITRYDSLAARTVFVHGALPSCGYFDGGANHLMTVSLRCVMRTRSLPLPSFFTRVPCDDPSAEYGWRCVTIVAQNVSALDYLTVPLAHRTVDGSQLFMPLTMRVSNDTMLWGHRSAFASLPDDLRHLRDAERPTTQHPPNLQGMAGDQWLAWERTNFQDYTRLRHVRRAYSNPLGSVLYFLLWRFPPCRAQAEDAAARNVSVPFMPFGDYFRHVFGRAPPRVLFFSQGAQFATSAKALRHTPRTTYAWLLRQIEAGHAEIIYYLELTW